MLMYRKDLVEAAGMEILANPTWDQVAKSLARSPTRTTVFTVSACVANRAGVTTPPS
ncbi:MAG: hypothetical protein R3E95_06150 [Thiolinea sp.]